MAKSKFQQLLNSAVTTNPEELKNWIEERINTKDENKLTALHKASEAGHLNTVNYLIQIGAHIESKDKNEETPLHKVAKLGPLEVMKLLVEKGAQIDVKDQNGLTPLHAAVEKGSIEPVKFLIEKGAQIDAKDTDGLTPLQNASRIHCLKLVKLSKDIIGLPFVVSPHKLMI